MTQPRSGLGRPPHVVFLAGLAKARVDYLLIGVMGLNHYAENAGEVFHTEDVDALLAPKTSNLLKACTALARAGYELTSNGEPLGTVGAFLARRILERRAVVRGAHSHGMGVDLVLEARPFTYTAWKRGRRKFRVDDIWVYCAGREMILAAKEDIGRPKDKAFLKVYRASTPPRASSPGAGPRRPASRRRTPAP
ncbi:MAG: hypothetical protein HY928_10940 [Elusimicrobia bacterium]|nr:hypothetical protein [Elusimicrobiota bacterium]